MATYTDSAGVVRDSQAVDAPSTGLTVSTVLTNVPANRSTTVGTVSAEIMPPNTARKGYILQNQSASATIYIRLGATATLDNQALRLGPGDYYETGNHVGLSAVNAIATAAGALLYGREW